MSQKCEIVYVVTHEAKLDGKWEKAGRVSCIRMMQKGKFARCQTPYIRLGCAKFR